MNRTYLIIRVIAILAMVVGLVLATLSYYVYKKRNLAEAYDAIYDRGYVERAEKRKQLKAEKKKKAIEADIMQAEVEAAETRKKQAVEARKDVSYVNSGATVVLTPSPVKSENTVVLNANMVSHNVAESYSDFKIIKDLYYASSKETIS